MGSHSFDTIQKMRELLRQIKGRFYQYRRAFRENRGLLRSAKYDVKMYKKHARVGCSHLNPTLDMLEALLIKTYHVIEKGLAMPDFKPRFGGEVVYGLWRTMNRYLKRGGSTSNPHFVTSAQCLRAYAQRHNELGTDISDLIDEVMMVQIEEWCAKDSNVYGGVVEMSPEKLFASGGSSFSIFVNSRSSCRHFDQAREVSPTLIEEAVKMAIRTPSVCNRQPWRVHAYYDKNMIEVLLACQNGNRGFGQQIPCVLLVTVDLSCFEGSIERYQSWIDGGMFSMSLIYALHSLKLGSVALNWSAPAEQDIQLRKSVSFPDTERVIMLVGTGHPAESYLVPFSQRREVHEVLFSK